MDTCSDCGGLVSAKEDRIECYGCGKDYGLSKNYQGLPPTPQPTTPTTPVNDCELFELQEIRRALNQTNKALEQSNEYLQKIREYIGWFWWLLIGIPIILFIIVVLLQSQGKL
jgi:hypothetical protein